jgi:hypothetical protein
LRHTVVTTGVKAEIGSLDAHPVNVRNGLETLPTLQLAQYPWLRHRLFLMPVYRLFESRGWRSLSSTGASFRQQRKNGRSKYFGVMPDTATTISLFRSRVLATIGRNKAVAWSDRVMLSGFLA